MDAVQDIGSPVTDSGYDTAEPPSPEPPGQLEERKEFVLQSRLVFVTYSRSRVSDKEEFHKYLKDSLEPNLPYVGAEERATVEIFGSKELHEDDAPHYHVVLRFSKKVHWRQARQKLAVWIEVDGERVIDTHSIYIRRKKPGEPHEKWLQDVQGYVAKDGDVFGSWIGAAPRVATEKTLNLRKLVDCEWKDESEAILKEHFPEWWVRNHPSCQALLKTKRLRPPPPRVPTFEVKRWRVPAKILQWRSRNFPVSGGGRPTSLVIIGPSKYGKTEWALSFGRPAMMNGGWDMDQLLIADTTHLVLNDVELKDFPNKRDLAGCQMHITVTGCDQAGGLGVEGSEQSERQPDVQD
ncbi:hypothetical protein HIM_12210 [Hirsutella minnesotensis 3608]|uniref:Uncharacterized protein n=1 Tax=Hirsutella minnesotensis 3608 TaxID=1043627 RepID=A0A0F8A0B9_9HYPO|nr:hypothetical protein HIM_12210 [Hirsutella minnesotensis 3608]